jgi:hypothetical protein
LTECGVLLDSGIGGGGTVSGGSCRTVTADMAKGRQSRFNAIENPNIEAFLCTMNLTQMGWKRTEIVGLSECESAPPTLAGTSRTTDSEGNRRSRSDDAPRVRRAHGKIAGVLQRSSSDTAQSFVCEESLMSGDQHVRKRQ